MTGDFRFRSGYSKHNPRKMVKLWAEKEYRNLNRWALEGRRGGGREGGGRVGGGVRRGESRRGKWRVREEQWKADGEVTC